MSLLLIFSATLLVAVLLSAHFSRTVLSAAVLFLLAGIAAGQVAPQLPEPRALAHLVLDVRLLPALLVGAMGFGDWLSNLIFALVVITLVRVLSIVLALIGSGLSAVERLTAAWFGPRGFASVVYALLVLSSVIPDRERLFIIVATVVIVSIVVHSSTDVPVAHYFRRRQGEAA